MKKMIHAAISIAAALLLSTVTFAAGDPQFTVDLSDSSADVGDVISVSVKLKNNPGFETLGVDVLYDTDVLTCTEVKCGSVLSNDEIMFVSNPDNKGKASTAAISLAPVAQNGTLFELTFLAEATGSTEITVAVRDMMSSGTQLADSAITNSVAIEVAGAISDSTTSSETPAIPANPAERPDVSFSDVPTTHWAYSYIQNAVKQGLFTGISNTQFGPDMNVTRGMFVTVLYSSAGTPAADPSTFSDVSSSAWYAKSVSWASAQGIVSGIGDNKFGPDLSITREQLALILYQYAKGTSPGTEAYVRMFYPDGKDIHSWALTAMSWAVNEGLISGKSGNRLAPQDTATRAEVAVIMQNFVNLTK